MSDGIGRQLGLPLRLPPRLTRADFVVGEANRVALAVLDAWPAWPGPVLLSGPPASGKSHLAALWRERSGAATVTAADFDAAAADTLLATGAAAVEDIDAAAGNGNALFHLINRARERGATLLLTARDPLAAFAVAPADLGSRLRAAQPVAVAAPDDSLLRDVLAKLFADRQLRIDPALIDYLLSRMERTFSSAIATVDRLDAEALAAGRPVTRALAAALFSDTSLADIWDATESPAK